MQHKHGKTSFSVAQVVFLSRGTACLSSVDEVLYGVWILTGVLHASAFPSFNSLEKADAIGEYPACDDM